MRYITVEIYQPKDGTVSPLNSISSRFDRVALPCTNGPLEESDIAGIPVIKIVRRTVASRQYIHAEPEGNTRHAMYGGCILDTSDSRFHEATGVMYPLKLHDRFENAPIGNDAQELLRPEWEATAAFIKETDDQLREARQTIKGETMPPTIEEFKTWCRDNAKLALAVCEAQAVAETIKLYEDAYIKPIFDSFNFIYEGNAVTRLDIRRGEKLAGKPIPSPDDSNFCLLHGEDEPEQIKIKLRAYYAACDAAHREHGYTDLPEGHSPTLRAEHLHRQAEWALMDSAGPLFGLTEHPYMPDDRKRYLELLIGSCIKALDEIQKECELETEHKDVEPSPLDPNRLRCAKCCIDLTRKAA